MRSRDYKFLSPGIAITNNDCVKKTNIIYEALVLIIHVIQLMAMTNVFRFGGVFDGNLAFKAIPSHSSRYTFKDKCSFTAIFSFTFLQIKVIIEIR